MREVWRIFRLAIPRMRYVQCTYMCILHCTVNASVADQVSSYQDLDRDPGFLFNLDPELDRTWTQGFFLQRTNFIVGKMCLYPCIFLSSQEARTVEYL